MPARESYGKGVASGMLISNALGPIGGPVKELEILRVPSNTEVRSGPKLLVKTLLGLDADAVVVHMLILMLATAPEKAWPYTVLGRMRISRIKRTVEGK